jgi:group I intron endonuclease
MIHSIYKFTNRVNNKVYIGYTNNPQNRLRTHKHKSITSDTALYCAARKYGWDNFTFEVIYQSLDGDHCLNVMEEHFIKEYKSYVGMGFGYNMTFGADGQLNPTPETRYKIGSANRGKVRGALSEETKRKIGLANSNKKRTDAEKEHLRQLNLGKKNSIEARNNKSKLYTVTSPSGDSFDIVNLCQFCKDNNLNQGAMGAIARGKPSKHKGWSVKFR